MEATLQSIFHEWDTGFTLPFFSDEQREKLAQYQKQKQDSAVAAETSEATAAGVGVKHPPHAKICFVLSDLQRLSTKAKYRGQFSRIHLAHSHAHYIADHKGSKAFETAEPSPADQAKPCEEASAVDSVPSESTISALLASAGVVSVNTLKYFPLTAEQKDKYESLVQTMATQCSWKSVCAPPVPAGPMSELHAQVVIYLFTYLFYLFTRKLFLY